MLMILNQLIIVMAMTGMSPVPAMQTALDSQIHNEIAADQMHNALSLQQNHNESASKHVQNALALQASRSDLTSRQMQEALKQEEFKNDQNFENLKHFQNYNAEMINESNYKSSSGTEMKFTNLSADTKIENYIKVMSYSKTFPIQPNQNATVYVNLLSTTRYYHPQFRIYEKINGNFNLMQNINFSNKFFLSNKGSYVIEIGTDNKIDTLPFQNMKTGGFELIISSEVKTIAETLNDEGIRVQIWGFEGMVPFTHNAEMTLFHDSWKYISHGILNYQITPFYDTDSRTITVYYHKGSSQLTGKKMRSSKVEVKCNRNLFTQKVFYGTEPSPASYHFDVQSRRICDLINLIE
jgi:hypothetical protein